MHNTIMYNNSFSSVIFDPTSFATVYTSSSYFRSFPTIIPLWPLIAIIVFSLWRQPASIRASSLLIPANIDYENEVRPYICDTNPPHCFLPYCSILSHGQGSQYVPLPSHHKSPDALVLRVYHGDRQHVQTHA